MKSILKKLDDKLGKYIDEMDGYLQEPIRRTVTGEVFLDGSASNGYHHNIKQAQVTEQPAEKPQTERSADTCETEASIGYMPIPRRADA